MTAYQSLEARFKRIAAIGNAAGILQWDSETMMPPGAAQPRSEVLAELSVMIHEMVTDPALQDLVAEAEDERSALDEWQRANLREMARYQLHANAVPARLVEATVLARSESVMTWREARRDNDFKRLAPKLEALFALKREEAAIKSELMGLTCYEALLDEYDPGRRELQVDALFDDLADYLPGTVQEIVARQAEGPAVLEPEGPFSIEKQQALSRAVMEVLDFPFDRGRLDTAEHPFSGGAEGDIRITTRYAEDDFTKSLMAVIHEVGHALYEDGRPQQWRGQPVGESRGMTLHESQSLLLEMQASRSEEFIRFLAPRAQKILGGEGPAWEGDNMLRLYRRVQPSLIRVFADEVTYPLHVILRYRLEKAIVNEEIAVADLPVAWNELMQEYLGIVPDTDTDGVMQDVHWPEGLLGYFPTYSLGALAAAQIFTAANAVQPDILPGLGSGNFKPLFAWLDENIRSQGCLHEPDVLIQRATGAPLGSDAFKASIEARYLS